MTEAQDIGREIVAKVVELAELVARARALPGDGTPVAGGMAAALLEQGGHLPDGNPNRLRWPITESPPPKEDPRALGAAMGLVQVLVPILARRLPGVDAVLARTARYWSACATKAQAERAIAQAQQPAADDRARMVELEHEQRLAAQAARTARNASHVVPEPDGDWPEGERVFGGAELVPSVG